jgi:photosystem II stability/assembly factor-like uncharacterized protein
VTALIVSPTTAGHVLAGLEGAGVYKTVNGGFSWGLVLGATGQDFTFAPAEGPFGAYYAATPSGVFRSSSNGMTWLPAGLGGLDVRAIEHHPASSALLAALPSGDVRRSTDSGANWVPADSGLGSANIYSLAADPSAAGVAYACGLGFFPDKDLFKTTNMGVSWTPIESPAFPPFITPLVIVVDPTLPSRVFFASLGYGVFRSTDGGATWDSASVGIGDREVVSLAPHPTQPGTLVCGTQRRAVYLTTNAGASWVERSRGLSGNKTLAIVADPPSHRLWVGDRTGIILSTNDGAGWFYSDFEADIGAQANALALDPHNPNRLYAGTSNAFFKGDVLLSTDGGAAWSIAYSPTAGPVFDVVVDPGDSRFVYAAFSWDLIPGGVARSTDSGVGWTEVSLGNVGVICLAIDPSDPTRILAGTDNGLQESTDRGASFHVIGLLGRFIQDVVFVPSHPESVYVATNGAGVMRSGDGGFSFVSASGGLASLDVRELAVIDRPGHILVAATRLGPFRTSNHGAQWTAWDDALPVKDAQAALARSDVPVVYLGTEGAGLWLRADSLATDVPLPGNSPPALLVLEPPAPNPVRGLEATIAFSLGAAGRARVDVFDVSGRLVRRLIDEPRGPGRHVVEWDCRDDRGRVVGSGGYVIRVEGGSARASRRLVVLR